MRRTPVRFNVDPLPEGAGEVSTHTIEGELPRAAALMAICFLRAGLARRLILANGCFRDHDVLELTGITADEHVKVENLKAAFDRALCEQQTRLRRKRPLIVRKLDQNLEKVGELLSISSSALQILKAAILTQCVPGLADVWRLVQRGSVDEFASLTARALDLPLGPVIQSLGRDSPLRNAGLLNAITHWDEPISCLEVQPGVAEVLLGDEFDAQLLLRAVTRPSPPPTLTLDNFRHQSSEVETALRYLKAARASNQRGINLLLHGEPGVGKTQLARLLAAANGVALHEVPTECRDGSPLHGSSRLGAFLTCQKLLQGRPDNAILFDEIDDVFTVSDSVAMHRRHGGLSVPKAFINNLLEDAPVASFWIANAIFQIDPAFIRRFDLIIEVKTLPRSERLQLLQSGLDGVTLPSGALKAAAGIDALSPALIKSSSRVIRMTATSDPDANLMRMKATIQSSLSAMGRAIRWPRSQDTERFRMDWINCNQHLDTMLAGIARTKQGRICLYGPPGTGKTAFAHHLGNHLDRPVVARKTSDLMSKWVGETEQRIAAAFEEAEDTKAVLLIDEADSFLAKRQSLDHQWQITQVNEMLTQMEAFSGVFIASTNLVGHLDDASLRRFDFKLRFDPPNAAQRRLMVIEAFRSIADAALPPPSPEDLTHMGAIDRLHELTPGDVAVALRQCQITAVRPTISQWIAMLNVEATSKRRDAKAPIGFMV
jgi:transitional endoplasmic reticulum ATPase